MKTGRFAIIVPASGGRSCPSVLHFTSRLRREAMQKRRCINECEVRDMSRLDGLSATWTIYESVPFRPQHDAHRRRNKDQMLA